MNTLKLLLAAALFVSFSAVPAFAAKKPVPDACKNDVPEGTSDMKAAHKAIKEKVSKGETVSPECLTAMHMKAPKGHKEAAPTTEGGAAPTDAAPAPAPEKQ
jgi:hypothetical protein